MFHIQPARQTAWHAPAQVVVAEGQLCQLGEAAQLRRYLPAQVGEAEAQNLQVGEAAQLRRYLPAQLVVVEYQPCQVGEAAQLRRYLPAQLVDSEVQPFKVEEAAQLRRYLPAQLVVVEAQLCNTPVVVSGDVQPFAEGGIAQPVLTVIPVLTVRCVVEDNQGFPVRFDGAGGRGRRCRRSRRIGGSGRVPLTPGVEGVRTGEACVSGSSVGRSGSGRVCRLGGGPFRGWQVRRLIRAAAGQQ